MEAEVAPVMLHCKVEEPPAVIVVGFALKLIIAGGFVEVTVTTAVAVVEP